MILIFPQACRGRRAAESVSPARQRADCTLSIACVGNENQVPARRAPVKIFVPAIAGSGATHLPAHRNRPHKFAKNVTAVTPRSSLTRQMNDG
jgi:hypothetical protein